MASSLRFLLSITAALSVSLAGCAGLTPTVATAADQAFDAACPEETMIPVAGAVLASACPLEDAAFAALIARETAPPVAATAATVRLWRPTKAGEKPTTTLGPLQLAPLGKVAQGARAVDLQRLLIASAPATTSIATSSPATSSSPVLPRAPAVLPMVVVDAGADGGR